MSTEEDVEINVTMRPRGFEETRRNVRDISDEGGRASTSYRALSRDFMMTARSINIINREFLGNNVIIKDMVGLLYGLTAALRLVTVAEHLLGTAALANVAKHIAEAGAIWTKVAAMIAAAAVNPLTWGLLAGAVAIGVGTYAAMKGGMKSMQLGGIATYTGPHFLHAGEVVTNPQLGQSVGHTFVNIDMKTGPISSKIDVENMLTDMGTKVAKETRRRTGHG